MNSVFFSSCFLPPCITLPRVHQQYEKDLSRQEVSLCLPKVWHIWTEPSIPQPRKYRQNNQIFWDGVSSNIKKKKNSQCLVTATPILLTIKQSRSMTSTKDSSSLNADLSELPTMWLWMPLCVPLWNTIYETVANFLDIKFPYHKIHPFPVVWWVFVNLYSYRILLPLLRSSLVSIFGQCLHI